MASELSLPPDLSVYISSLNWNVKSKLSEGIHDSWDWGGHKISLWYPYLGISPSSFYPIEYSSERPLKLSSVLGLIHRFYTTSLNLKEVEEIVNFSLNTPEYQQASTDEKEEWLDMCELIKDEARRFRRVTPLDFIGAHQKLSGLEDMGEFNYRVHLN